MKRREGRVLGAAAFTLGVGVGTLLDNLTSLSLQRTLTIGDLLEPIAGVVVACVVYQAAGQLTDRHKFFLTLVTDDLQFVRTQLEYIDEFFANAAGSPQSLRRSQEVLKAFKQANMRIELIKAHLAILEFDSDAQKAADDLQNAVIWFRQRSTGGTFPVASYLVTGSEWSEYQGYSKAARSAITKVVRALVP